MQAAREKPCGGTETVVLAGHHLLSGVSTGGMWEGRALPRVIRRSLREVEYTPSPQPTNVQIDSYET
jgi:hypothetical protein